MLWPMSFVADVVVSRTETGRKKWSLEVTESDAGTFDFPLRIHSNYGPTHTISENNGDLSRKSTIFPTRYISRPRGGDTKLELRNGV